MIAQRREVPLGWVDIEKSIGVILTDMNHLENASEDQFAQYWNDLREQKRGK